MSHDFFQLVYFWVDKEIISKFRISSGLAFAVVQSTKTTFHLYTQVIVEVRDNLRGLGAGVKRSIDDVHKKSYIRSKTRERFGQAASVISGPQRFVAADTTQAEKKSSLALEIGNQTKPTGQPNDNQVTLQASETKEVDIFAE